MCCNLPNTCLYNNLLQISFFTWHLVDMKIAAARTEFDLRPILILFKFLIVFVTALISLVGNWSLEQNLLAKVVTSASPSYVVFWPNSSSFFLIFLLIRKMAHDCTSQKAEAISRSARELFFTTYARYKLKAANLQWLYRYAHKGNLRPGFSCIFPLHALQGFWLIANSQPCGKRLQHLLCKTFFNVSKSFIGS